MEIILALAFISASLLNVQQQLQALQASQTTQVPISKQIDDWLIKLETCESRGKDITILDTNNRYSYGWFQFQRQTFNHYGDLYGLPHDNIHSFDQQFAIAHKMIENGLQNQWYNCTKSIGNPPSPDSS